MVKAVHAVNRRGRALMKRGRQRTSLPMRGCRDIKATAPGKSNNETKGRGSSL